MSLLSLSDRVVDDRMPSGADQLRLRKAFPLFKLESLDLLGSILCPDAEVVEDYRPRNGYIEACYLVRVLLDVDEVVADRDLVLVQTRALVPEHE